VDLSPLRELLMDPSRLLLFFMLRCPIVDHCSSCVVGKTHGLQRKDKQAINGIGYCLCMIRAEHSIATNQCERDDLGLDSSIAPVLGNTTLSNFVS
jgi:hypothetical protein